MLARAYGMSWLRIVDSGLAVEPDWPRLTPRYLHVSVPEVRVRVHETVREVRLPAHESVAEPHFREHIPVNEHRLSTRKDA